MFSGSCFCEKYSTKIRYFVVANYCTRDIIRNSSSNSSIVQWIYMFLLFCLSSLSIHLSDSTLSLSVYLSDSTLSLSVYLSDSTLSLSIHLSDSTLSLSVYLSDSLYDSPSIYLCLFVHLSIYRSSSLSVSVCMPLTLSLSPSSFLFHVLLLYHLYISRISVFSLILCMRHVQYNLF